MSDDRALVCIGFDGDRFIHSGNREWYAAQPKVEMTMPDWLRTSPPAPPKKKSRWKPEYDKRRRDLYASDPVVRERRKQQGKRTPERNREYMREWLALNRDHVRAYRRAYADKKNELRRAQYATDPIVRETLKARAREWWARNPEKKVEQRLRAYGLTADDYFRILGEQGGGCAICGAVTSVDEGRSGLHIDHCHVTGKVRGILCSSCNLGLGKFSDDPDRLECAAAYLRASRDKDGIK